MADKLFSSKELRRFASDVCGDDPDLFTELLEDCRNDLRDLLGRIEAARRKGSWRDLNRAAHSIKSTGRTFGSPLVKERALGVEKLSENESGPGDPARLDRAIADLRESCAAFGEELARIGRSPGDFLKT
ncbi:MAG: Hpt domain-containing protein [Puniceicoccaceae bacterium]